MSKILTCRLDDKIIDDLDAVAKASGWINRSYVLRQIIIGFLKCMSDDDKWKLLSSFDPYGDGITIRVFEKQS